MSELHLLVSTKSHNDFSTPLMTFSADVVFTNDAGQLRNPSWDSHSGDPYGELESFRITAQTDDGERWYGFHAEYREPYSVRLDRAEAMVKTLRKVRRGLKRIAQQRGHAADLHTYVTRVAEVLKVSSYVRHGQQIGNTYAESDWTYMDADALRWWLDTQGQDFRKQYNVSHAE